MAFEPKFFQCDTLENCADAINLPHEDYPKRVPATLSIISTMIEQGYTEIDEFDIKQIHAAVMWDLSRDRGCWRSINVTVGNHVPPPPWMVASEIKERNIFPVVYQSEQQIIDWYADFQTIHPFCDGNGRVGGIVVAVLSYPHQLLAPMQ